MEIIYFIFSVGKANGGHYRSLVTTAEAFSKTSKVKIIVLGYTYSHIIQGSSVESEFVYFNGLNVFSALKKTSKMITEYSILHAFDSYAYFLVRLLGRKNGSKIAMTKCGGTNPRGFFPSIQNLVLFSKENYNYFKQNQKYNTTNLELIPNRIGDFDTNKEKVCLLKSEYNLSSYDKVVLRIGRIGRFYEKSFIQSIKLQKYLENRGYNTALLIIGNIQDQETLAKINNQATTNTFIISNDEFTENAREIIDVADWIIGTGRGFMEACAKGKVMFAFSHTEDIPMLINEDNFDNAFSYNFSERIQFTQKQISENTNNLMEVILNQNKEKELKELALQWFNDYFFEDNLIVKYKKFYTNLLDAEYSCSDLIKHWGYFVKNNLGTWYRQIISKFYYNEKNT